MLQLPLYSLWQTGTNREIGFAALHCSAGDVLIATTALLAALLFTGLPEWPIAGFRCIAIGTIVLGLAHTLWSEYLNTSIRGSWSYSEWMPMLLPFGTGLSPLAQWLVIPALALGLAWRTIGRPFGA